MLLYSAFMDVSVTEFRANLRAYLDEVRAGEEVVITERGVPVARLVPVGGASRLEALTEQGVIGRPERSVRGPVDHRNRPRPKGSVADLLADER